MRGLGTARAAISIVNALPLGVGAAIGIEWPARVTARIERTEAGSRPCAIEPPSSSTPIVRAAARTALGRFGPGTPGRLRLVVRSTIPVARGLKSSSAVSSAVAFATARACGAEPSPEEVAGVAAEVGRATGVSATGAFDDALAGLVAGGVVTDNRRDTALRRFSVGSDLAVALWVPDRRHPRSPAVRARFRHEPGLARRAADAALAGDWVSAMEANSTLVERVMGYRYDRLHAAALEAGATVAGVSGLGPTFAALAPLSRLRAVRNAFPREGQRKSVRLFAPSTSTRGEGR